MARYHVNPETGVPGLCTAQPGRCPFAGSDQHYSSPQQAITAFEERMEQEHFPSADPDREYDEELLQELDSAVGMYLRSDPESAVVAQKYLEERDYERLLCYAASASRIKYGRLGHSATEEDFCRAALTYSSDASPANCEILLTATADYVDSYGMGPASPEMQVVYYASQVLGM